MQYSAKEKADYKGGKAGERRVKKEGVQIVNAMGIIHSMWKILRKCEGGCEARIVRSQEYRVGRSSGS